MSEDATAKRGVGVWLASTAVQGSGVAVGSAVSPSSPFAPIGGFLVAALLSLPLTYYLRRER